MHKPFLATLFSLAVIAGTIGCRHTTAPIAGPTAPGTLAPVSPGQLPLLGPMGGNTRVTPPATGTIAPSGYFGALAAPVDQSNLATSSAAVGSGTPAASQPGVQVAGWTETNSVTAASGVVGEPNPAQTAGFGSHPSNPSDPRSGGMQVHDLTAAPPPPGYRPTVVGSLQAGTGTPQTWQSPGAAMPATGNAINIAQSLGPAPMQNPVPMPSSLPQLHSGGTTVSTIPPAMSSSGPSTEPVATSDNDLIWRRPGGQF